ncbi:MAG: tail fiber domain-containing protein [Flavobacteriales bacterium]|nr:tail fiber domain-containing protein [Flavobacteriales bacterium]
MQTANGGDYNVAVGALPLYSNTTGDNNVAVGPTAMFSNTTGSNNTAVGNNALRDNTTGVSNVAIGVGALKNNATRTHNVAVGDSALFNNDNGLPPLSGETPAPTGYYNTAMGSKALYTNSSGYMNTAIGHQALNDNASGERNTAMGVYSLTNSTGGSNTAVGSSALEMNTTGDGNTAVGESALWLATGNAEYNTGVGYSAGSSLTTARYNTAIGFSTLDNNTTGHNNTAIGRSAGPSVDGLGNTTALGYDARPTATNMVRIGNTLVTSIGGQVGWTTVSDARYKRDVRTDVSGLDFIMALRPVTYTFDLPALRQFRNEGTEFDKEGNVVRVADPDMEAALSEQQGVRQTGFLAQEVEQAAKRSGFDFSGVDAPRNEDSLYGLRYAEFVVPLVKAVQEQQARIDAQQREIELLQQQVQELLIPR